MKMTGKGIGIGKEKKGIAITLPAFLLLFCLFFLSSCAPPAVKEVKLIYPSPPDEPKIVYLASYKGESDFKKRNILDIIIGEKLAVAELRKPYGVAASGDKIYVADTQNNVLFVFDTKEKKVTFLGDRAQGRLASPVGIAIDSGGTVFVSDIKQKRVFGYDAN